MLHRLLAVFIIVICCRSAFAGGTTLTVINGVTARADEKKIDLLVKLVHHKAKEEMKRVVKYNDEECFDLKFQGNQALIVWSKDGEILHVCEKVSLNGVKKLKLLIERSPDGMFFVIPKSKLLEIDSPK